jgi:hypothetical protein
MPPSKEREASRWLIAERARCRREGMAYALLQVESLPHDEALAAIKARLAYYESVMADPRPTGVPGE